MEKNEFVKFVLLKIQSSVCMCVRILSHSQNDLHSSGGTRVRKGPQGLKDQNTM